MKRVLILIAGFILINGAPFLPHAAAQSIPESRYRAVFGDYLARVLQKERSDIVVSKLKVIGDKPLPAGKISVQLFQKEKRVPSGNVRLVAIIRVDGAVCNRVRLSGWVDIFDTVVCAARHLNRGEIISADDVFKVRKNVTRQSTRIVHDIDHVVGYRTRHRIQANTCIREMMLEKAPVVEKGSMVMIVAESDSLCITAPGRVLMKGDVGDLVRVQNLMSKKEIYAEVVNPGRVRVNF